MRKALSVVIIILALFFVYVPIIVLAVYSFTESKSLIWSGFSFEPYLSLFSSSELVDMLINTVVLAVVAAAIATILGTIGAIGIYYNKKWVGKFTAVSSKIPVINAEIVTAISLAFVFSFVLLRGTYFSLLIGHIVICVPFVVLSVIPKLKQMDGSLYEAALDLGATPTQALFKVVFPEILSGIISGFLLSITLSLDDYMVSAYNKPDGFETISTFVYKALAKPRNAPLAELRALSSIIFVIMLVGVLVVNWKMSSENKKNKLKEKRR